MALRHVAERGGLALSKPWVERAWDHAAWEEPAHREQHRGGRHAHRPHGRGELAGRDRADDTWRAGTLPRGLTLSSEVALHHHISAKRAIYREHFYRRITQDHVNASSSSRISDEVIAAFRRKREIASALTDEMQDTEGDAQVFM